MQNDYIPLDTWFECIVLGTAPMFMVVPSDNGNCLVQYPFKYGNVIHVQG